MRKTLFDDVADLLFDLAEWSNLDGEPEPETFEHHLAGLLYMWRTRDERRFWDLLGEFGIHLCGPCRRWWRQTSACQSCPNCPRPLPHRGSRWP